MTLDFYTLPVTGSRLITYQKGDWLMALITISGLSALVTVWLYVLRFIHRKKIQPYFDVTADIGGHFFHGIFMVYMAAVMFGLPALLGWRWIALFFYALFVVFIVRLYLVVRVECRHEAPLLHFEPHSKWWWELLHSLNHAAMAYMFLPMEFWNGRLTLVAMSVSGLIFVDYARKIVIRMSKAENELRRLGLYSDWGHVTMAFSMLLMFYSMQWGMDEHIHAAMVEASVSSAGEQMRAFIDICRSIVE